MTTIKYRGRHIPNRRDAAAVATVSSCCCELAADAGTPMTWLSLRLPASALRARRTRAPRSGCSICRTVTFLDKNVTRSSPSRAWRGGLAAVAAAAILIAGCGGTQQLLTPGSSAHRPCAGLPTAHRTEFFLALFGATSHLTKRFVCAQFGAPLSAKAISGGREAWSYGGGETLTFKDDRVVAASGEAHIGG